MKQLLILASLSFLIASCQPQDQDFAAWYSYDLTRCSDPWGTGISETELLDKLSIYFSDEDIALFEHRITTTEAEACEACTCKTGQRLELMYPESDARALFDLGFELM